MNKWPKISVVTVNYNGAAFLERTITSVLSQNYPNLEYVIIDGGSDDDSINIIKRYESQLHYWVSESDKGMYDALQKGFDKTSGNIMAWINADDMYQSNAFFKIVEILTDYPQINWLTGVPAIIDENDSLIIPKFDAYPSWSKIRFYAGDYKWIQQESTIWTRKLWIQSGGLTSNMKFAGDFDLWIKFFEYERLYVAPILIGAFRISKTGQKSVENRSLYEKEAANSLSKKRRLVDHLLIPFHFFDRVMISFPFMRDLYYRSGFRKWLGYPQRFEFNSKNQKLELK